MLIAQSIRGQFKVMLDTIASPEQAFGEVRERPIWLLNFVMLSFGTVLLAWAMSPFAMRAAEQSLPAGVSESQIERVRSQVDMAQKIGMVTVPLTLAAKWALMAFVLWLVVLLVDGNGEYKQLFSVVSHANVITFINSVVVFLILKVKGIESISSPYDLQPATGLNMFVDTSSTAMFTFLGAINIFELWYVIVLTIGIYCVTKSSKFRALGITLFFWFCGVGLQVGIASLLSPAARI